MSKKILASIMTFIIFTTTLCKVPVFAAITYLDADGVTQSVDNATQITSTTTTLSGWHYMSGALETATRFEVNGSAHLILCDNCNLSCNGIHVKDGNNLTIYGQSSSNGILEATPNTSGQAGIGGNSNESSGAITINGGNIKAIGRGSGRDTQSDSGAGIGGGYLGDGNNITINGGTIYASIHIKGAAAIGGGAKRNGNNIKITGGEVTAQGDLNGCGIGSSEQGSANNIIITGGIVKAYAGWACAGIGTGNDLTISGGTVIASGHTGVRCGIHMNNFSTNSGKAFIEADAISDQSGKENWTGTIHIINDKTWIVGGNQNSNQNITVGSEETMTINNGGNLNQLAEFTNEGKMIINGTLNATGQVNWNSTDVTGSGQITPESAKIPANITVPNLNLDKIYDGKPINVNLSFADLNYTAMGKEGAATGISIVHKKNGQILSSAPSDAGNYSLVISAQGGRFYQNSSKTINYSITKLTPTVTAPTAKTLTYNKSAQELINAGRTTGGTLQYKLNNGSWQTNIPTATNAGTYTVWYKVVGNNEYLDVAEKSVSVTIKKATPNITTVPTAKEDLVYDSEQKELVNAGSTTGGTLKYSLSDKVYSEDIPTGTNAGTYDVYYKVEGNNNYNDVAEDKLSVTIAKADPIITAPTARDLTYNGDPQELVEAGSTTGGTLEYSLDNESYSTKIPTGMIADTYTVYYRVVGDDNYNSISEESLKVTIIIDKAIPETPPAPQKETKSRYSITLKPLEPNENGAKPEYKMLNGKSILEATPASQNQVILKSNIKLRTLEQENANESEYKSNDETPWQESNVFKNLIPNKEYTFYSRYAATEDGNFAPSLPSEPTKIRTLKKSSQQEEEIEDNKNTNNETDEPIKVNRNEVGISDKIQQIETENGIANIETKRSGDDIEVKITDENGNPIAIEDGIILVVECDQDSFGIVAATINDDGTIEKVIRKSVVKNGKIYVPLNCSAKIRIIDNSKLFYDVFANHWAYDAVNFVSAHELFNGTAPNIFEPETPMSRAMMVQVLHNLEDNPYQAFEKIFSDVNFDDWFAEAVTWGATHRGTIIGYDDGRFGPNDNITREQLATILYRYFGENEVVDTDLNFVDANQISNYALKALRWSVKYKIIQGKGNNILDSKGLATRAQVAQMFQNLMLNLFY